MPDNNIAQGQEEQPILVLIQDIKDGRVSPGTLTKDLRQRCVEVLLGEGYTVATMAHVLKRSDKTVKRDLEEIRERNAITPDVDLAKKIIGELVMYGRIHRDQLMKLARSKNATVSEKSNAEFMAFKVFSELIAKMQTLGYLPTKPQAIVGEIFHHVDGEMNNFDELASQIIEIEKMADGAADVDEDIKKMKGIVNGIRFSEKEHKGEKNEDI